MYTSKIEQRFERSIACETILIAGYVIIFKQMFQVFVPRVGVP